MSVPEPASHFIERPRLVDKISGKKQTSLYLLIAPAGYGKTTLAAQALARLPKTAKSWYHLDSQDNDPRRFLQYLIQGLSQSIPAFRETRLFDKAATTQVPIPEIVDDLCFIFQEYGGPGGWLVLDNWETVNDQPAINEIVTSLITNAGRPLKLIINSRTRPAFKVRKLQESGRAIVITERDLAFSLPEFTRAVAGRLGTRVDESQVEEIWRLTAGWCVNLGLILEIFQHRGLRQSSDIALAVKGSDSLADYIEEELLRDLDPRFVDFLGRCSVLDTLSPESCRAVIDNPQEIRKHLGTLAGSDIPHFALEERNAIRLHPLISQAAGRILRSRIAPEKLREVYTAATEYYRGQGRLIEAIDLLMELPDYDAALAAIDREWARLMETNSRDRAERWLARFPNKYKNHPLYIKSTANILSSSGQNRQLIDYLADKLDPAKFARGDTVLATLWYQYHWALLHISPDVLYDDILHRWEILAASHGPFNDTVTGAVENTLSYAAYAESRIDRAVAHMENALTCQKGIILDRYLTAKNNLAFYKHLTGRSIEALEELREVVAESERTGMYIIAPLALVNCAWIHYSMGQYNEAFPPLERVTEIMHRHHVYNVGLEMYVYRIKGLAYWYLGERERGMELLEKSLRFSINYDLGEHVSTGLSIEYLSLLSGQRKKVVNRKDLPGENCNNENRLFYLMIEATAAILNGRYARAVRPVAELLERAQKNNLIPWAVTGHFLHAFLADRQEAEEQRQQHLTDGLGLLDRIGWRSYQMPNELITGSVVAGAIALGIQSEVVRRLVDRDRAVNLTSAFARELERHQNDHEAAARLLSAAVDLKIRGLNATAAGFRTDRRRRLKQAVTAYLHMVEREPLPALAVKMLGRFSIVGRHGPVVFPRKKSRLLCQLLLLEHPKAVHEEVIIEQFWPESDPARGRANLRTTVKDMRRALDPNYEPRGRSYVEYSNEHYSIGLPGGSAVDVWEFERRLATIPRGSGRKAAVSNVSPVDLRTAIKLYEGDLLPEERFESFTIENRERLRMLFQDGCVHVARALAAQDDFGAAIDILEHGLELDPLWANGVQALMSAYAKTGEVFRALRLYRAYEKRLEQDLGLPPDREMQDAFTALSSAYYSG